MAADGRSCLPLGWAARSTVCCKFGAAIAFGAALAFEMLLLRYWTLCLDRVERVCASRMLAVTRMLVPGARRNLWQVRGEPF